MKRSVVVLVLALFGCAHETTGGSDQLAGAPVLAAPQTLTARLPDSLPDGLQLPHERVGRRSGAGDRLYNDICLDPPAGLQNTAPEDGRAIWFEDSTGTTIERLALYGDDGIATEALSDLRDELALCGQGVDHAGNPLAYVVLPQPELPHADETLQWYSADMEPPAAFVTVARFGRIVYVVDHRTEAALDQEAARWQEVIGAQKAVGSFAFDLCRFGFGRGCQDDPS